MHTELLADYIGGPMVGQTSNTAARAPGFMWGCLCLFHNRVQPALDWLHKMEKNEEEYVDVDVVELRAQADASMPASNNNVNYTIYFNF